jgi:hypothetical protein
MCARAALGPRRNPPTRAAGPVPTDRAVHEWFNGLATQTPEDWSASVRETRGRVEQDARSLTSHFLQKQMRACVDECSTWRDAQQHRFNSR